MEPIVLELPYEIRRLCVLEAFMHLFLGALCADKVCMTAALPVTNSSDMCCHEVSKLGWNRGVHSLRGV